MKFFGIFFLPLKGTVPYIYTAKGEMQDLNSEGRRTKFHRLLLFLFTFLV